MTTFFNADLLSRSPEWGMTAIESFSEIEERLAQCLKYIPYSTEQLQVWSPLFAEIIINAANLLDSTWKATTKSLDPSSDSDRLTLKNHYDRFGAFVAKEQVIFFGAPKPVLISPFECWQKKSFEAPCWWNAYNSLKHDRFSHRSMATLDAAINCTGALLLAVIYCGCCDWAIVSNNLFYSVDKVPMVVGTADCIRDVKLDSIAKIETKLFAHPLGVFKAENVKLSNYFPSPSLRFTNWWSLNAEQLSKTT